MKLRLKADLALVGATIIWGAGFVFFKTGLDHSSPLAFLAVRFALGSLLLGVLYRTSLRQLNRDDFHAGAVIGGQLFAGFACLTVGLATTTASKAAFINSSESVLPAVFLALFWGKRGSWRLWMGAAAVLAGLYFISVPVAGLGALNRADALVFFGAVFFSFHTISIGHYGPKHSVAVLSFLQVLVTAILAFAALPVFAAMGWEQPWFDSTSTLWVAVLFTVVGSIVIGFTIQVWAQRHTPASHAGLLFSLIPVFASISSYFWLGERMGMREASGAGLILLGIAVTSVGASGESEPDVALALPDV